MVQILEYATPQRPRIGHNLTAVLPLVLGTMIYAALCWPAAHQRGYPPMEHFWTGMPYLWVFPIPLFTLICPPGKFSRRALTVFALVTAYIDGCTVIAMVPHRFNPIEGLLDSPFFAPIHLVGTAAISWMSRSTFRILNLQFESYPAQNEESRVFGKILAALTVVAAAGAFPSVFRQAAIAIDFHSGVAWADARWADHSAYILSSKARQPHSCGNYDIYNYFDDDSGLPLQQEFHHEYETGYQTRIHELLSGQGVPPWSHKRQLVSDNDLLSMLNAGDLTTITSYPYDLSPNLVLARGGTFNRWGTYFGSGPGELDVYTRLAGNFGGGSYYGDAAVGRSPQYPGVIFVKAGNEWIVAVSEDGYILSGAIKQH
jgi:hypothetical protein